VKRDGKIGKALLDKQVLPPNRKSKSKAPKIKSKPVPAPKPKPIPRAKPRPVHAPVPKPKPVPDTKHVLDPVYKHVVNQMFQILTMSRQSIKYDKGRNNHMLNGNVPVRQYDVNDRYMVPLPMNPRPTTIRLMDDVIYDFKVERFKYNVYEDRTYDKISCICQVMLNKTTPMWATLHMYVAAEPRFYLYVYDNKEDALKRLPRTHTRQELAGRKTLVSIKQTSFQALLQ
jgi:hypothetical protein